MAIGRVVIVRSPILQYATAYEMKELNCQSFAEECNPGKLSDGETNSAEILLRYASFATAGLPKQEIDNVIAILAGQRNHAEMDSDAS